MLAFWEQFSWMDKCILCALFLLFVYQLYYWMRYMHLRTNTQQRKDEDVQKPVPGHFVQLDLFGPKVKGVSVIVSARNEGHNLRNFLQTLLEQDYPMYEVIVVNDGSEDDTQKVLDEYVVKYPRLKTTFVPQQARVLSSKKLALTLAVKAARYDYLLLTDADCRPESRYWIREMMHGFEQKDGVEIVLGYGAYFHRCSHLNRLIQYETLVTGLQYMGFARAGHPYMGVGRNLAYKKDLFVRNNGFVGLAAEQAGDDDLFVNRLATAQNTAVVSSPASVTWSVPKTTFYGWYHQRKRHLSVSPLYKWGTKVRLTIEPLTRGLFYAGLVLSLCMCSWEVYTVAAAMYLFRLIWVTHILRYGARHLNGKGLNALSVMWFDVVMPLLTLWLVMQPSKRNRYW